MPKPGPHLTPLDGNDTVFTMDLVENNSAEGDISPYAFNLNPQDKELDPWRKSVWETELSSPEQVFRILPNPKRSVAVYIDVSEVRSVDLSNVDVEVDVDMDVVWDHLDQYTDDSGNTLDGFPGDDGHCAIIGWPEGKGEDKVARRRIRSRLADRAHEAEKVELPDEETETT